MWQQTALKIEEQLKKQPILEIGTTYSYDSEAQTLEEKINQLIVEQSESDSEIKKRLHAEFLSFGPLVELLEQSEITEIIISGPKEIWFEKNGQLQEHRDHFFSELSFKQILERIGREASLHVTDESPIADGPWRDFRMNLVGPALTRSYPVLCLRRHPKNPWTLDHLCQKQWCSQNQVSLIQKLIKEKANFIVIGGTGSGKTSVLNACLQSLATDTRVVSIEDSSELHLPSTAGTKLLTREDPNQIMRTIDQSQLVKQALRMRPDRIVMGEIRGHEAKDFLMAISTGHDGSWGTLHASHPHQALIRLEMLIQLGAPQWGLQAIRQLIHLSLTHLIICGRQESGHRFLNGIYRITSLEENGFLTERIDL